MSESFTIGIADPVTGLVGSWHEKAEELRLAYSERMRAKLFSTFGSWQKYVHLSIWKWFGGAGTTADQLEAGSNLQADSFWSGQQTGIEEAVNDYAVDVELVGMTSAEARDTAFDTFYDFCQHVGSPLWTGVDDWGWPRSFEQDETGAPIMIRGAHEQGDIIGPWLVDSLLAAYRAMLVCAPSSVSFVSGVQTYYVGRGLTKQEALDDALDGGVDYEAYNGVLRVGTVTTYLDIVISGTWPNQVFGFECTLVRYSFTLNVPSQELIKTFQLYYTAGQSLQIYYSGAFKQAFPYSELPADQMVQISLFRYQPKFTNA